MRVVAQMSRGIDPGPAASLFKIRGTEIFQRITDLTHQAIGNYGLAIREHPVSANHFMPGPDYGHTASEKYLNSRKLSIYGGSNEIQRNIIAKAVLGPVTASHEGVGWISSLRKNRNCFDPAFSGCCAIAMISTPAARSWRRDEGWSRTHWKAFAELGLCAAPFQESAGGLGGGPLATMIIMQEFGRHLVVEPFFETVVLAGGLIEDIGSRGAARGLSADDHGR